MTSQEQSFVIGTRKSKLAMWQAEFVRDRLVEKNAALNCRLEGIVSEGDRNQAIALSKFATKGVFTKELDRALLSGSIDAAVHSLKDLPTTMPDGLKLAAILKRGRVEDALIINSAKFPESTNLSQLPDSSVIGTSSLRRRALLAKLYPQHVCKDIRGNVQTRLRRLDEGDYDAIVLAAVGLERVGLGSRISSVLDPQEFPHAVGQGALAVVCRDTDVRAVALMSDLSDQLSTWMCTAERALLRTLEGGCKVPIAARTSFEESTSILRLYGCIVAVDGLTTVENNLEAVVKGIEQADRLGAEVAAFIRDNGGLQILQDVRKEAEQSV